MAGKNLVLNELWQDKSGVLNKIIDSTGNFTLGTNGGGNLSLTINSATAGNNIVLTTYSNSSGLVSTNAMYITAGSGNLNLTATAGYSWIKSGANQPMYLDLGGLLYVRDIDSSNANRLTIDSSSGNLWSDGTITLGNNNSSNTTQKAIRLNSGVVNTYLHLFVNPDGGMGMYSSGGGTFTFGMSWRIDFRSAEDCCFTASRYVDIKDRDASDAVRVRFDTGSGNLWLTGSASIDGNITTVGGINAANLPTSDPLVAGQFWRDVDYIRVSLG